MFGFGRKEREMLDFLSSRVAALEGGESNLATRIYVLEEKERKKHIVKQFNSHIDYGKHRPDSVKLNLEALDDGTMVIESYGARLELNKVCVEKLKEFLSDDYGKDFEKENE